MVSTRSSHGWPRGSASRSGTLSFSWRLILTPPEVLDYVVVFSALYGLIYVLMRMKDYALLVGSIASFTAIVGTMCMTPKLDWYGVGRSQVPPQASAA